MISNRHPSVAMVTIVTIVTMAGVSFVFLVCIEISAMNRLHVFPQRAWIGVALCATRCFAAIRLLHTAFHAHHVNIKIYKHHEDSSYIKGIIDSNFLPSSLPTLQPLQLSSHHCQLHHLHKTKLILLSTLCLSVNN